MIFIHKDDLISKFQTNMEYRNLSSHTLKMYSYYVYLFLNYVKTKDYHDYNLQDSLNFVVYMKNKHSYKPQS